MTGPLATGDSIVESDDLRIESSAGDYSLRVKHSLAPDHFVDLAIRVRDQ